MSITRTVRRQAIAVGLAVVVAGCGTTVSSSQVGTTASGEAAGSGLTVPSPNASVGAGTGGQLTGPGGSVTAPGGTATAPGAVGATPLASGGAAPQGATGARVTGPISLGLLYAVNDAAAPAGIDNGNTITPGGVMHAFVESWNNSGGIGGRHINPVYFGMHSYNNNYEAQIASACSTFTEDNHVAAVVMELQYYSEQLFTCLSRAGVPIFSGDFAAPDRDDARRYLASVDGLTTDEVHDRTRAALDALRGK